MNRVDYERLHSAEMYLQDRRLWWEYFIAIFGEKLVEEYWKEKVERERDTRVHQDRN